MTTGAMQNETGRGGVKACEGPCGAELPLYDFPLIGANRPGARRHDCRSCRASSLKTMAEKIRQIRGASA